LKKHYHSTVSVHVTPAEWCMANPMRNVCHLL